MSEQNNTENKSSSRNPLVRVIRIELFLDRTNILKFVPSSFMADVLTQLDTIDELEIHFKIKREKDEEYLD